MKSLAFVPVFCLITGSLASEAPKLDLTVEKLTQYGKSLSTMPKPIMMRFWQSKTGSELSELASNVSDRLVTFEHELPPNVIEAKEVVGVALVAILEKAYAAGNHLMHKSIVPFLASALSYYYDPLLEKMEPYLSPFLSDFIRNVDHLVFNLLPDYLKPLDDQAHLYLKQLEDTQPTLRASADQVLTWIRQELEALNKNLEPYLQTILEESEKYKAEFREWEDIPIFP